MGDATGEDFKTFWYGDSLCPVSVMCLNSFVAHGHQVTLYGYSRPDFIHIHVQYRSAEEILPRESVVVEHGGYEYFSDIFRYHLLRRYGGWWIDTDVVCNINKVPVTDFAFARESKSGSIANGQIKFPKGHAVIDKAIEFVGGHIGGEWGAIGPRLLTALIEAAEMEHHKWQTSQFYPIIWVKSAKFLLREYREEMENQTQESPFTHIYTN